VKNSDYRLKGQPFSINEQFPVAVEEKRKRLYPVMKENKTRGKKEKLVRDRLYIDGVLYVCVSSGDVDSRSYSDVVQSPTEPTRLSAKRSRVSSTPTRAHDRDETNPKVIDE